MRKVQRICYISTHILWRIEARIGECPIEKTISI